MYNILIDQIVKVIERQTAANFEIIISDRFRSFEKPGNDY
jgi:hypothetical protein